MFSLRKRGNCSTKITGKAATETAASLVSTIPNYDSMRQATCFVDATQNVLNPPPPNTNCNPSGLLLL
jgi:hypothetical protein